jgi:fused signal recognition particle receptor
MDATLFQRLKNGLAKSRASWIRKLEGIVRGDRWDEKMLGEMEETLLAADVGIGATQKIVEEARKRAWGERKEQGDALSFVRQELVRILAESGGREAPVAVNPPEVVLFLGVNGVGKTTTIGKMAAQRRHRDQRVLLVAADTFRAAAIEQLESWGRHVGAEVIKHQPGADPSAVAFDGVAAAKSRKYDVVLVDTAGRLHTKGHLIEELKKIRRVIAREHPGAPHETLMVLDATTGQNALQQARIFKEAVEITGIVLTKLDGTARGGVIVGIQQELAIPVRYIGVGEKPEDLQPFDPESYVQALFAL